MATPRTPIRTTARAALPHDGRIRRDLTRLGLKPLQLQSKATTRKAYDRRAALVDELIDNEQVAVLRALIDRQVSLEQLVDLRRERPLTGAGVLAALGLRERLWPRGTPGDADYEPGAVRRLLAGAGKATSTGARYIQSFATLRRKAGAHLPDDATVATLAIVPWSALAAAWGGSAADWNRGRAAVSRLLTLALGRKTHEARGEILAMIPIKPELERTPDLTPDVLWQILDAMPEHLRAPIMALALTGMRDISEYLACRSHHLLPHTRQVQVPGTKTTGSASTVGPFEPEEWAWIRAAIPCPVGYKALRAAWIAANLAVGTGQRVPTRRRTAADGTPALEYDGPRLHDLRHLTGQLAADAGVHQSKIQRTLRHTTPAMTQRYVARRDKGETATAVGKALRRTGAAT